MIARLFFVGLCGLFTLSRCATVRQPSGGPKDTIPPTLIRSIPENNQKNFKGKTVTLLFDEAVKIKDAKEVIITPSPGKDVSIIAKQRSVIIEPKKGWKDSTTYSISFRDAIQDISESNPAENLHLAFSTGSIIDSLSISGTVRSILKETIPEKITIAIYQSDTFDIFKHQPVFLTKSTKKLGKFKIENLKPGTYFIYAFDDKNKNLKVDSQSEMFGFLAAPIHLSANVDTIQLRLVNIDSRPLKLNSVRHNEKLTRVKFNKNLNSYSATFSDSTHILSTFGSDQSEINFYHPADLTDSIPARIHAVDSIGQFVDSLFYIKPSNSKTVKEKFKFAISSAFIDPETGDVTVTADFTVPLKKINPDTISIKIDSASSITILPNDIQIDTPKNRLYIHCTIDKPFLQELYIAPQLRIAKGVFISVDNDSSKSVHTSIPYLKTEETGTLAVTANSKKPAFLVQLVSAKDYKIQQQIANTNKITFRGITPAEYKLRSIIDANGNGLWDPGNFYRRQEPENVIYYKSLDGKYTVPIRANWEVGPLSFSF